MASDAYDGKVSPGGAPQSFRAHCLTVTKLAVDEEMSNNCYLLRCDVTGEQLLVDASAEAPRLLDLIGADGLTSVVTTHQHWDHHRALAEVVEAASPAWIVAGEPDASAITEQTGVEITRPVRDGDRVSVGVCDLEVIAVAGHTPGSICLLLELEGEPPHLFTGDSLFPGGVGNTFGDDAAFRQLLSEVEVKIFGRLPDETIFHPGHGADGVLGEERPHLQEWRDRGW